MVGKIRILKNPSPARPVNERWHFAQSSSSLTVVIHDDGSLEISDETPVYYLMPMAGAGSCRPFTVTEKWADVRDEWIVPEQGDILSCTREDVIGAYGTTPAGLVRDEVTA